MEVVGNTWNYPGTKCNIESPVEWILRSCEDSRARLLQHTMPRLEELKEQCHRVGLGQSVQRLMNLVITPSSVPDFTIPRSYNSTCTGAPPSSPTLRPQRSCESLTDSCEQLPALSGQSSPLLARPQAVTMREGRVGRPPREGRPLSEGVKRSTSEPTTPVQGPHRGSLEGTMFRRSHCISYEMIDDGHQATTNADPCSLAAMSLPHLKTKTKFGFETLSECPTTLRKESLFHDPDSTPGSASRMQAKLIALRELQNKRCGSREEETMTTADNSLEHTKRIRSRRRNVVYQVAPLGVSNSPHTSVESNTSSTASSPAHSRTASIDRVQQLSEDGSSTTSSPTLTEKRRRFHRRRPATVSEDDLTPWQQTTLLRPEEKAEAGQRRYSGCNISLNEEDVQQLWRVSALTATVGVSRSFPGVSNSNLAGDSLEEALSSLATTSWERKSQLKFALEYSGKKKQLVVHLQEGISLPGPPEATNAFVKLHLHPLSNGQRHTSAVVRQTNDPVFDQTFPFTDITREQLPAYKLRIKVLRKEGLLRRNESVGELEVNLSDLDFAGQSRYELLRDIQTDEIPQELGRLQTKIRFQANCETLDVSLLQIKDLPCNTISRAPDPYVTLELRQPGRPDIRMQSKVKKKVTSSPINETFSLRISPRIEDLNYTSLSLTVYDREMIRSDRVIGEVRLGFGATEKSEFDQWNQVLSCPGAAITSWHMLMEEQ